MGDVKVEPKSGGYVYLVHTKLGTKIGKSKSPVRRIRSSESFIPATIDAVYCVKVDDHGATERDLHAIYEQKRIKGEWFDLKRTDIRKILKKLGAIA